MRLLLTSLLAVILAFAAPAAAQRDPAPPVSAEQGLAIRGYDPAAFFTEGRPIPGSPAYEHEWNGARWRFASAETRASFAADPAAFAPHFGGHCAWAVSQNYLAPGDPNHWKIVEGRLYLNANARAKSLWQADQAAAIERGHANWPMVLATADNR